MVRNCKCIKEFYVEKCDNNGFLMDNEYEEVEEGSIWEYEEGKFTFTGAEMRLEDEEGRWLEISKEDFNNYFKEIGD